MKLSREEVEGIAELARLALTEAEKRRFAEQLSDILDFAAKLNQLDTDHIPPTASVLDAELRLREDEPHLGLDREAVLNNAAESKNGQFKVPPVLGG